MQKFEAKFQNVPTDAPLVCSSTSTPLNRDQSLSEAGIVRASNNLEVDPLQHRGGQGLRVPATAYVLNQRGRPLMPCSARKARILLQRGEAKVVKNYPFVIQMKKATGEQIQQCSLGIDSGYKYVGFSVITDKKEIVSGTLTLDNRTSERLTERRMYKRKRRGKLWHRKPRFSNRAVKKGWIPPSTKRRFDTHVAIIDRLKKLLPILKSTIELGNFDINRIENPGITGSQYQQGPLFDYENMRIFLIAREHGKCQLCGKGYAKSNPFHIHHTIPRSSGGTNREKNLALLHKKCHNRLHKEALYSLLKKGRQYKDASFMSTVRNRFKLALPECTIVFGYETSIRRHQLNLEKSHNNDAFIIAGGTTQKRATPINLGQKHKNSRVLRIVRKNFGPSIRRKRYSIQPYDIVIVNGKKYMVNGCCNYGKWVKCYNKEKSFYFNTKRVNKILRVGSVFFDMFPKGFYHASTKRRKHCEESHSDIQATGR